MALIFLLVFTLIGVSIMNANIQSVLLHTFKVPVEHFGFVQTVVGIGGIIGVSAAPFIIRKFNTSNVLLSSLFVLGSLCILIFPLNTLYRMYDIVPIYVWCMFLGITTNLLNVPLNSLFIQTVPEEVIGRGASIIGAIQSISQVFGLLLGGWIAALFGVTHTIALAGGFIILVCLCYPFTHYYKVLYKTTIISRKL
ncbi:MFS transporter [Peribacillus deserti]|uniref:Major facilitator superfamily (MFS) profile domain-containing protein n=1 Tax=Peribacillus deserti TaxID=673318 RepID=A0A2N5M6V4_9BACI|nr:MFS transporter [Peribacillus deserti]PLT30033.1 hypothetical protein CUU66_09800 [Peribacillus deserti]